MTRGPANTSRDSPGRTSAWFSEVRPGERAFACRIPKAGAGDARRRLQALDALPPADLQQGGAFHQTLKRYLAKQAPAASLAVLQLPPRLLQPPPTPPRPAPAHPADGLPRAPQGSPRTAHAVADFRVRKDTLDSNGTVTCRPTGACSGPTTDSAWGGGVERAAKLELEAKHGADLHKACQADPLVLRPLVPAHLGLCHVECFGELTLGKPGHYPSLGEELRQCAESDRRLGNVESPHGAAPRYLSTSGVISATFERTASAAGVIQVGCDLLQPPDPGLRDSVLPLVGYHQPFTLERVGGRSVPIPTRSMSSPSASASDGVTVKSRRKPARVPRGDSLAGFYLDRETARIDALDGDLRQPRPGHAHCNSESSRPIDDLPTVLGASGSAQRREPYRLQNRNARSRHSLAS